MRSFNDTPAMNTMPATQRAPRFAVPPRTTQREAEQHGMLDRARRCRSVVSLRCWPRKIIRWRRKR